MLLSMQGISKSFGANQVLRTVDFQLQAGEIHALLGENGAGKSTLMNILGGVLAADEGVIYLSDRLINLKTPLQAMQAGIAFIHQELNLINDLAVYENIFLGCEIKKNGLLDHRAMQQKTSELFKQMDVDVNPKALVSTLDASYKQIVEICRALMMNASIIIMDEPTTSLTEPEIDRVFDMLNALKKNKVGVIFISHKLREVMRICDSYTVLRDGKVASTGMISETTQEDIACAMVGHKIVTQVKNIKQISNNAEALRLSNFTYEPYYRDVSISVNHGEIVGVTGLLGDGRRELFRSVFGDMPGYTGEIYVENKAVRITSTSQALEAGIGYVPGNRKENAIIKDFSVLENTSVAVLRQIKNGLFLSRKKEEALFEQQKKALKIKAEDPSYSILSLSGGNQQKVILARWLSLHPSILVLDNPTQGVDVGAKEEIYEILMHLAASGMAVVVLSTEAQEIIRVCDRAYVMYHGSVIGNVAGNELNEQYIMQLATGIRQGGQL